MSHHLGISALYWSIIVLVILSSGCKVQHRNISYDTQEEYLEVRQNLIRTYKNKSFSIDENLNAEEQRLERHLSELQRDLLDHYKSTHYFPPARNFYGSKGHIESTELFKIIQEMPKGGALHIHTSAMGDLDWVINKALSEENMYIYWSDKQDSKKGTLYAFKPSEVPDGFEPVRNILNDDQNLAEFKSYFLFDQSFDQDSIDIWGRFEKIFGRIQGFVNYQPIFEDYLVHGLSLLAQDGVQHIELRMPFENHMYSTAEPAHIDHMEPFIEAFNNVKKRMRDSFPDFTLKIIHANLRFKPNDAIWSDMQKAHKNRQKYPDLLVGYDLVAEEDAGHPTLYHLESFLKLRELNKSSAHSLDLYLHDGESDWVDNENLYDAIMLGTKRIGHGFNLFRYPNLIELVKDQQICIEVNPLSNQVLGYVRDLRMHPAHNYITQGVPITISSDDPLIFDYEGLSYDYWHIYMAWQLSLRDLKQLSKNGILYSSLNDNEKALAISQWEKRWNRFITQSLRNIDSP